MSSRRSASRSRSVGDEVAIFERMVSRASKTRDELEDLVARDGRVEVAVS